MLTKIYSSTYAMNGTNSVVYAFFNEGGDLIQLETLRALSFTSSAEVNPVFALGTPAVTGYTYGAKVISGVMQFIATDQSPFIEMSRYISGRYPAVYDKVTEYEMQMQNDGSDTFNIQPETFPPFGLLVISEPEIPRMHSGTQMPTISYFVIAGVKVTSLTNQMDAESGQGVWHAEYMASQLIRHNMESITRVDAKQIFEQAKSDFIQINGTESLSNAILSYLRSGR
jgi:hypothetical protein